MNQEDMDKIVFKVTEQVLLRMPEVIGNLIMERSVLNKLTESFYNKHPEYRNHKGLLQKVFFELEQGDISKNYEEIFEEAEKVLPSKIGVLEDVCKMDDGLNGMI